MSGLTADQTELLEEVSKASLFLARYEKIPNSTQNGLKEFTEDSTNAISAARDAGIPDLVIIGAINQGRTLAEEERSRD